MKVNLSIGIAVMLLCLTSCSDIEPKDGSNKFNPIELTRAEKETVNNLNSFAFDFFHELVITSESHYSVTVSPLSLASALGLLANGASEPAQSQILETLDPNSGMHDLNERIRFITQSLMDVDKSTSFESNNLAWVREDFQFQDSFSVPATDWYNAKLIEADTKQACKIIADWLNKTTHGLITDPQYELLGSFTLINTVYFKGAWSKPFDEDKTIREPFKNHYGTDALVDMMNSKLHALTGAGEDFISIRLPYGNNAYSFYSILPKSEYDIFLQNLDYNRWKSIKEATVRYTEVNLKLPKFKINYDCNELQSCLTKLGITNLFNDENALSRLCTPHIDATQLGCKQKVVMSVDEEGTEAAAETVFGITTAPGPDIETLDFHCDRPFIFIIEEQSTGTILFMGSITHLQQE